jgi:two-component system NarL family sensor kinase
MADQVSAAAMDPPSTPRPNAVWTTLATGDPDQPSKRELSAARVMLQVGLVAALVIALVAGGSVILARRTAEREAVNGATQATDLLADAVVQPALEDALLSASPAAATARLDRVVRNQVLGQSVVRVKLWSPQGRIVYSDEPRLIGKTFALGAEERGALITPTTQAEVTQLQRPENQYERGRGKLLEVYRPVWTPSGQPLLFETYTRYQAVAARTTQLWRGFAGIMVSSLLLLVILLLPVLWALLDRLRRGQRQRESLLQHAVDASTEERQRIAGTLHDGVVQELAATSFAVTAAADQADALGQPQLAERIRVAAGTVRTSIGGLRSLLVDIYPPSLRAAGLVAALADLAAAARSRDVDVRLDLPDTATALGLDARGERLIFRVAQECLRNVARHAAASSVDVRLRTEGTAVVLEVADDGTGFDLDAARDAAREGHLGLRLLPDLATQSRAVLRVATAPGAGTRWRLEVPVA